MFVRESLAQLTSSPFFTDIVHAISATPSRAGNSHHGIELDARLLKHQESLDLKVPCAADQDHQWVPLLRRRRPSKDSPSWLDNYYLSFTCPQRVNSVCSRGQASRLVMELLLDILKGEEPNWVKIPQEQRELF